MVAGHYDQGVVEFAHFFQQADQLADIAIKALDLEVVVGHIAAHLFGIGEVLEKMNIFKLYSALDSRASGVGSMRVARTEPQAKRHVLRASLEEPVYAVVDLARRADGGVGMGAWPPALAVASDEIPLGSQELRVLRLSRWPDAPKVAGRTQSPELLAGDDRPSAWCA